MEILLLWACFPLLPTLALKEFQGCETRPVPYGKQPKSSEGEAFCSGRAVYPVCLSVSWCVCAPLCVCVHVRARVVIWLPQGICAVVAASGEVCTSAQLYASVFQKLELLSVFLFGSW